MYCIVLYCIDYIIDCIDYFLPRPNWEGLGKLMKHSFFSCITRYLHIIDYQQDVLDVNLPQTIKNSLCKSGLRVKWMVVNYKNILKKLTDSHPFMVPLYCVETPIMALKSNMMRTDNWYRFWPVLRVFPTKSWNSNRAAFCIVLRYLQLLFNPLRSDRFSKMTKKFDVYV